MWLSQHFQYVDMSYWHVGGFSKGTQSVLNSVWCFPYLQFLLNSCVAVLLLLLLLLFAEINLFSRYELYYLSFSKLLIGLEIIILFLLSDVSRSFSSALFIYLQNQISFFKMTIAFSCTLITSSNSDIVMVNGLVLI